MKNVAKTILKEIVLLVIGGTIYYCIELIWRGYSHPAMVLVGGICFIVVGGLNNFFPWELGLIQQSLIGACCVTVIELISGLILNVWLGLGIWDYSNMPCNFMGQICLPFFFAWIALSCVAIIVDDYLRYWLFNEEKPHYTII